MALLDSLRAGVKIANNVTASGKLQTTVTYYQDLGSDARGARTLGGPTPLHAIVDYKSTMVRTREGILTATRATVTLLNVAELLAATQNKGIGNNDKIVFADGDTGPILDISGFIDSGTGIPVATTVMMG